MISEIVKRDGRRVPFDESKIAGAIKKAFAATGFPQDEKAAAELAAEVSRRVEETIQEVPDVESIQDVVEQVLIDAGHVRTAKAYILYRANRSRVRQMNTRLMKIYEDITFKDASDSDIKRENANIDGNTAMGSMLKYGSEGAKQFYEMFILKPEHAKAHREGDIHIHDMDFYTLTTTCCQIDLLKLFKGGFTTGHGVLREPNSIASYSALACIAIQANQNDQHGGQSIVNFDYGLAPGVKKTYAKQYRKNILTYIELLDSQKLEDATKVEEGLKEQGLTATIEKGEEYTLKEAEELQKIGLPAEEIKKAQEFAAKKAYKETDKETYQAVEALIHNLNTMHSRAGAQTPFSSVNYGMDTSAEGRMVVRNMLLATEAGLGHGETPIFPIQIFRVKEGINYNEGEPNYDLFKLACRVSAKRLFPNFSFQDAPFNKAFYKEGHPETEIAYMGCRTRVISNVYDPSKAISNSRGNLSFTTINLPRLAILAHGNIDVFFQSLDRKIDLVIDQLLSRFAIQ
ncbi:anaerobic ribonucleoside triphosphate reductase, partial [bacterium]|nr:anaerobic ribonucleoside triphosphate reductase [bacterium]